MKRTTQCWRVEKLDALLDNLFFCPSCTTLRTSRRPRTLQQQHAWTTARTRPASTLTSSTAVNATKNIPPRYKPLYDALGNVRKTASAQVNLSRLQLALQGLESEAPTTRVAVLGLDTQVTARRLVRLLLADALEDESKWEKDLLNNTQDSGQALILRYGQLPNTNLQTSRRSLPILNIPSAVLERYNVEILVSSISSLRNGELLQGVETVTPDAFLSPSIETPTSAHGRQTTISQPVHTSLLVANGLDELSAAAELLASTKFVSKEDRVSVRTAVNFQDLKARASANILIVDVQQAEDGLAAIRRSVREATTYEHKWVNSGLPIASDWLAQSSALNSKKPLPPPVRSLVSSILAEATHNLNSQAQSEIETSANRGLSLAVQTNLESSIEEFSRNAHQELQSGLASAWSSRNWRKLAWFKLFWRVDDVGLITADLITNAWLPKTERAVYELSGRLSQVGITPVEANLLPPAQEVSHTILAADHVAPATILQAQSSLATDPPMEPALINTNGTMTVTLVPTTQPVPISYSISRSRAQQMEIAILDLSSTAQQIVLKTLSISGLSAGLSALTYVSLASGSLYEAGTIFALGTSYALWRMQGDWYNATRSLENKLLDEGRIVIQKIVGRMRDLVRNGSKIQVDEVELQTRLQAEAAVKRAREELERLEG